MRIIAGQRRGHKFEGPKGNSTRPTSDLVREAIFNILGDSIAGLVVVDLFAGTGALGLEALSRGASRAIFVERNRENVALIRHNVAILRYEDRAQVLTADAYRFGRAFDPIEADPMAIFLDPPYREFDTHPERVTQLLNSLVQKLPARSIVVVEASRTLDEQVLPEAESWDVRRYGGTQVAFRDVPGDDESDSSAPPVDESDSSAPPVDGSSR